MDVTFARMDHNHYGIAVSRQHGPDIPLTPARGYDDWLPHDLARFVVEKQFAITLGVFGQIAAGGGSLLPAPAERRLRTQRSAKRLDAVSHSDVDRSEKLVGVCVAAWKRGAHGDDLPGWLAETELAEPGVAGCVGQLDAVARRWHGLQSGRSLTLIWPKKLTVDPARSRTGRRTDHGATQRRGRGH